MKTIKAFSIITSAMAALMLASCAQGKDRMGQRQQRSEVQDIASRLILQ